MRDYRGNYQEKTHVCYNSHALSVKTMHTSFYISLLYTHTWGHDNKLQLRNQGIEPTPTHTPLGAQTVAQTEQQNHLLVCGGGGYIIII